MSFIDILAIYSIFAIWGLLFINILLSIGGYIYIMRMYRTDGHHTVLEYPIVTVMVPAHNESIVLKKTMEALIKFDYPKDRYEIIVVNDNSTDDSAQVLKTIQHNNPSAKIIVINTDRVVGGKGKSNALNIALSVASGSVIAIYDADNTPEKQALKILVENLMSDDKLGAVIGKFRTRNKYASLLTRFVNIETLAYQCMNQAGRFFFFKLCTIPGTNYVIRRELIDQMGGWDVNALAEDTEISFRLYRMGYYIKFIPQAVTWEQEPQKLKQWFKQRTRWVKGNLYVLKSNFKYAFDPHAGIMRLDVIYYALVYLLMFSSLIFSDIIFVIGILGLGHVTLGGFSSLLWEMAILLFVLNVAITLSVERNEFNINNILLTFVMLFTYAKMWVLVVANGMIQGIRDALYQKEVVWDKTERFEEMTEKAVKNTKQV
ncbi:cellulose synthase/poly-beta-1,6-N-acetylglucosamine synthase-like glycosyltransferase [Lacrimispora xylanisolvens]|uniref:Cellulose synthase/poly-beta-1,6-N-acetylglucosamine synthase-like glycosyltransferase n=1 Tax=Lacrimispora xylanisolvens TaxID=384636 RepID=A0A2S6HZ73_9FIRM|nr:glycosyltransferase [Hungatella xylanolytica]MBE5987170.1 glycosyltransferase family 2 protein [Paenibacillaceae bacterium]PPK83457.1 cellulose synthase/poly-beta-1,6-N-acetylglucosamine synthase-like glycosyltransferase [Hungatella xylanolytica]